jgi:hypothetical protein
VVEAEICLRPTRACLVQLAPHAAVAKVALPAPAPRGSVHKRVHSSHPDAGWRAVVVAMRYSRLSGTWIVGLAPSVMVF